MLSTAKAASDGTQAADSASGDFAKALALSNAAFTSSPSSSDYSASSACELSMSLDNILLIRLLANSSWCTLAILEIISITISALLPFTLLNSKF
jgi:hypothetical protein